MLHSSSASVHFPVQHSRAQRGPLQRGRLQISAAIKKGKEKNVVCTKTIVAKQETVGLFAVCRSFMALFSFPHALVLVWSCRDTSC